MISVPDNLRNDNQGERLIKKFGATETDFKNLKSISNKTIFELQNKNPNLLIFPPQLQDTEDKIGDEKILTLENCDNFSVAKISTGNLMGFVGIGGTQLKIHSRFDSDTYDYFLHYMLQKVFCLNIVDFKTESNHEDIFDFLIYLFPQYLNQAMSQGLYKEYQTFKRNDANIRGVIDVARHIRQNIPFAGKIAYNAREHSFDNGITQLIRHTIEYIKTKPIANAVLRQKETRENVQKIYAATETYKKQERQKIIHKNLKPLRTSFYTKYIPLQKLCRMILLHEQLKFGNNDKTVYGILFDGAWLWEEFLSTMLKPLGFVHPRNKTSSGGIYLFEKSDKIENTSNEIKIGTHSRYKRYPDFYRRISKEISDVILDAKYKHLENGIIDRDDMHQIISYMHVEKAKLGGLIYPSKNDDENLCEVKVDELGKLRGFGGTIRTYGIPIPQNSATFSNFKTSMEQSQKEFQIEIDKGAPLC